MSSLRIFFCAGTALLMLSACATAEEKAQASEARAAYAEKVAKVRLLGPKQIDDCEYVQQISVTEAMTFLGGQTGMENAAKLKLQQRAPAYQANGVRITDRQLDKGRGGYDKTRLTLYADLYACPEV